MNAAYEFVTWLRSKSGFSCTSNWAYLCKTSHFWHIYRRRQAGGKEKKLNTWIRWNFIKSPYISFFHLHYYVIQLTNVSKNKRRIWNTKHETQNKIGDFFTFWKPTGRIWFAFISNPVCNPTRTQSHTYTLYLRNTDELNWSI